ncbi:MAG TPA: M28 family peptidase [Saprospiraceae bacterium]|nr:M28 family peptidase [Saprospiraceae bacterium]
MKLPVHFHSMYLPAFSTMAHIKITKDGFISIIAHSFKQLSSLMKLFYKSLPALMVLLCYSCQDKTLEMECESILSSPQINANALRKHVEILADDNMFGRWLEYGGETKAANYIKEEMQKIGLLPMGQDYLVPFFLVSSTPSEINVTLNDRVIPPEDIILSPLNTSGQFTKSDLIHTRVFSSQSSFQSDYSSLINRNNTTTRNANILVLVPEVHRQEFNEAQKQWKKFLHHPGVAFIGGKWPLWFGENNIIFVLTNDTQVDEFSCSYTYSNFPMNNVVGVLPGKSKPEEIVIYSAHFDHLGVFSGRPDSIANGANDNASGVAALLAIAEFYSNRNENDRTLWFVGFNAEEIGLRGAIEFSSQLPINPSNIKALFNLDMLANPIADEGNAYLVGYERTTIGQEIENHLKCSTFKILSDKNITSFNNRMDHKPFFDIGIKAHSITTYSGDNYPQYHDLDDEIDKIDFTVLEQVTKAIILGTQIYISD